MKKLSSAMKNHLASDCTTLATCWKLTRQDGTVMGFTDHDQGIDYNGVTYVATSGFTPSTISSNANMAVDTQDVEGVLNSEFITEEDILAGLYDAAEIEVLMVNFMDLSQGQISIKKGWLGEVVLSNQQFYAELRGLTQRLTQTIGELYSPSCRAALGDARCGVDLAGHQFSASVTTAADRQRITASGLTQDSQDFVGGSILFTSGDNQGLGMEIKEHNNTSNGAEITLALPMPFAISVGDAFTASRGCDKTLATCKAKFDNIANFRGEPHVPGLDKMFETAGTRSSNS